MDCSININNMLLRFACLQPYSVRLHDIIAHTIRTSLIGTQTESITQTHQPHNKHPGNFKCLHRAISFTNRDTQLMMIFSCNTLFRHILVVLSLLPVLHLLVKMLVKENRHLLSQRDMYQV